jgi:hypothetical protein
MAMGAQVSELLTQLIHSSADKVVTLFRKVTISECFPTGLFGGVGV